MLLFEFRILLLERLELRDLVPVPLAVPSVVGHAGDHPANPSATWTA
jgi:hypothetical protein